MNPDIKRRWVDALRSGQYTQTRGRLSAGSNCFCATGVLCDVVKDNVKGDWTFEAAALDDFVLPYFKIDGYFYGVSVPAIVIVVAEITANDLNTVVELNDAMKADFATIAEWIEDNL